MYRVMDALKVIEGKSRKIFKIKRFEERKRIQEIWTNIEARPPKSHMNNTSP